MFAKLSTLALVVPLVAGITLNTPTGTVVSGGQITVTWTATTSDPPYFSLELVQGVFNNEYAVQNSVQTALGMTTFTLPSVPGLTGYTLQAVATNDVNTVYSTTGNFPIAIASGSTTLPASTVTATPTASGTGTVSSPTATNTTPVSSVSSTTSSSSSGTPTPTPTSLSSGAASFKMDGILPAAALVLSAVAGVAMVF